MEIVKKGNTEFLTSDKLEGVTHGFSTRNGGVSKGDFASLNVGLRRGDNPFDALKNIEICCDGLNLEKKNLTLTYQTHTANVRWVEDEDVGKGLVKQWGEGVDGILTQLSGVPLMCYSADCVPVLIFDPVRKIAGAIHSGWRGTAANIVKNALKLMGEKGSRACDVKCFIGPAIGACCYEVSENVGEAFCEYGQYAQKQENGKYAVDLKNIVRLQLEQEGVGKENIELADVCTACENERFFSHRKQNGRSGLFGGFIQLG